ncbi:MAG: CPBP family intramembrane metalloprotease [Ruminococcaceae bacterium]|nr:CPBP family intramembrane metalloprotease [Oscillospiraceae bacterium]
MVQLKNANEICYRKITADVGVSMLVFLALLNVFGITLPFFGLLCELLPTPVSSIVYQLIYGAGYLFSFMFPAVILKSRIQRAGYLHRPMKTELRLSPYLLPILAGGIVLIWTQSYINADMVSVFDYSEFSQAMLWGDSTELTPVEVVLQFIVIAMVPAFCEEFLFRGAILENLLPFGRGKAILISSLFFSIMHQNAEQILYAFAAGILLGVIYERTGSIWNCTFLHLVNNFLSFAMMLVADKLGGKYPEIMNAAMEAALCAIGVICIAILVLFLSEKKPCFADGVFGKTVGASDSYAARPVSSERAFRLFLSVPNVMFFAFSALQILALVGMALLF